MAFVLVPPLPIPVNLVEWRISAVSDGKSATRWLVRVAGDLAERQHGVVAAWQLLQLGFTEDVVNRLVRDRHLRPLHHGIYAVGHRVLSDDGRRMGAQLACGDDSALSHWTSNAVHGVIDDRDVIDVTVVDGVHHERPGIELHRSKLLVAQDVMVVRGLTVTRPARALLELAGQAPGLVTPAVDRALRKKKCSPAALRNVLDRHRRVRGRRVLLGYLATRRAHALKLRSELERLAAELILGSDLPEPLFNAPVAVEGERLEVDVWWPRQRLVLELDGREYHEGVIPETEDTRRDALLRGAGQHVRRAAWWDVTREPGRLLSALRRDIRR